MLKKPTTRCSSTESLVGLTDAKQAHSDCLVLSRPPRPDPSTANRPHMASIVTEPEQDGAVAREPPGASARTFSLLVRGRAACGTDKTPASPSRGPRTTHGETSAEQAIGCDRLRHGGSGGNASSKVNNRVTIFTTACRTLHADVVTHHHPDYSESVSRPCSAINRRISPITAECGLGMVTSDWAIPHPQNSKLGSGSGGGDCGRGVTRSQRPTRWLANT